MSATDIPLCAEVDPELFCPDDWGQARRDGTIDDAKFICGQCPLRETCLQDALDEGDDWTIRGATTPDERRAMQRRPRLAAEPKGCGGPSGARMHRYRGEPVCDVCRERERADNRARSARQTAARRAAAFDGTKVERAIAGDVLELTSDEALAVIRALVERGLPDVAVAARIGRTPETVRRHRHRHGIAQVAA